MFLAGHRERGRLAHAPAREGRAGGEVALVGGRRQSLPPRARWTPEERLADMDSLGVDVHVVSPYVGFYNYQLDTASSAGHLPRDQRRDRWHGPRLAPALRRARHAAHAGREGVDRRAGALHDPARPQGRGDQRPRQRPHLRGAGVPAVLEGGRADGRGDLLPPGRRDAGGPAQHAVPPAEHDRQSRRPRGDVRHARARRRDGRPPRPQDRPRPRRRLHLLRDRPDGPRLAGAHGGARSTSASRPAPTCAASTTTASCTRSRHCAT